MVKQEQVLRTRNIRKMIDKVKIDRICRMCGEIGDGSFKSEWKKLVQKECKHHKVVLITLEAMQEIWR